MPSSTGPIFRPASSRKPRHVPPGTKFRDHDRTLCHVRGTVDDMIVFRFWVPWKKRWAYGVKTRHDYDLCQHRYPVRRRR